MTIETAEHNVRPPRRPMLAWAFLLPILFLVGVLWQASQSPQAPVKPLLLPSDEEPVPHPKPNVAPVPAASKPPASTTSIFVPAGQGIHRIVVPNPSHGPVQNDPQSVANRTVNLFLQKNAKLYPPGTKLHSPVRLVGGVWQVDFNGNLLNADFWRGEKQSEIAIYALVNTMAGVSTKPGSTAPAKVQILVEGKPASTVGQWDIDGAIDPSQALVDQS